MTKSLSTNTSEQTIAQVQHYRDKQLAIVLGYTNQEDIIENSVDSYADSLANSSVACRILNSEIKTCIDHETLWGSNKHWTYGCGAGKWNSSGISNRQTMFEVDGILYMVVGFSANNNRIDLEKDIISRDVFTNSSGLISSTDDGLEYVAINALPTTSFGTLSSKYTEVSLPQEALVNILNSSTSLSTRASNICGSGNETTIGSCGLYHKEAGYDAVAGVSYDGGDIYKCDCTECYRCLELADALDMNYTFQHLGGSTKIECDYECGKGDHGICDGSIDWDDKSFYSQVISNAHINKASSAKLNATIIENNESESGAIVSIDVDFTGLSPEAKLLERAFEPDAEKGELYVPCVGSCEEEGLVGISVKKDAISKRWVMDGIKIPTKRGKNHTSIAVDPDRWSAMFPLIDVSRLTINIVPVGGWAMNIPRFVPLSCVIHKVIKSEEIANVTDAKEFNFYTISTLKDENGASLYSGHGEEQADVKNLVSSFIATGSPGFVESAMPSAKSTIQNTNTFDNTYIEEVISSDSVDLKTANTARIHIQTAFPDERVGDVFSGGEIRTEWTINSIDSRPYGSTLVPYDALNSEEIHRNKTTINLDNNPDNVKSFAFELKIGSGCRSISGE